MAYFARSFPLFGGTILGDGYLTTILESRALTVENNAQAPILFWESNRTLLLSQYWAMALGAVFALAVIPAVSEKVKNLGDGWTRWTSTLATIGFAVTIFDNYWAIIMTPRLAVAYQTGDQALRSALTVPGAAQMIDIQGWLGYGAVGLWVLVISLLALRGNVFPRLLAYLGIVAALAYFLVVVTMVFPDIRGIILIIAVLGGILLAPIWYGWMGIILYRNGSH